MKSDTVAGSPLPSGVTSEVNRTEDEGRSPAQAARSDPPHVQPPADLSARQEHVNDISPDRSLRPRAGDPAAPLQTHQPARPWKLEMRGEVLVPRGAPTGLCPPLAALSSLECHRSAAQEAPSRWDLQGEGC